MCHRYVIDTPGLLHLRSRLSLPPLHPSLQSRPSPAPAACKSAVETELVPDASKPAAAVDPPAAGSKPAPTVSQPAAIASVDEPAAAEPTSHPAPTLPEETFRVPDPVQPKGKAAAVITTSQPLQSPSATQDPALAAVPGIPLSSSPAPTHVDRSQGGSSSVGAITPITPAQAADRRDHRLNRNLPAKLLTFWGHVLEPKEADETWDENNTIAQGWLDDFVRKEGSSQSARPSP